jgi:hypothetical protein
MAATTKAAAGMPPLRWNADENCFYHWREKFGRIYIETIKYPTDVVEPWWDVFDVVDELRGCKFGITFDAAAAFTGNRERSLRAR